MHNPFPGESPKEDKMYRRGYADGTKGLRDEFAMALSSGVTIYEHFTDEDLGVIARLTYRYADAMLKERLDSRSESGMTKTADDIKAVVERIREGARDPEVAHGMEDDLYLEVLTYISKSDPKNAKELAAEAIKAAQIDFPRWCA